MSKYTSYNGTYSLVPDALSITNELPVGYYRISWNEKEGYSLIETNELSLDEKVYGVHESKVNKVVENYKKFNRSLGIILSGDKGIGKSLFAKMLCIKMIDLGHPIIFVDTFYPGIGAFLDTLDKDIVLLFDEFDKSFKEPSRYSSANDDKPSKQDSLLSLFDATSNIKRMYIVTCNDYKNINEFLVNRPGRFHYHFRFNYPTQEEIDQYMIDNLGDNYNENEVREVVKFSKKIPLNYDCLRSIAFELSNGCTFKEAIEDLNIINTKETEYSISALYDNGEIMECQPVCLDLFSDSMIAKSLYGVFSGDYIGQLRINPRFAKFDTKSGCYVISSDYASIRLSYDPDDNEDIITEEAVPVIGAKLVSVSFRHNFKDSVKYAF